MAKKKDNFFYQNFKESIAISLEAAEYLKTVLASFDAGQLETHLEKMHEIEHKGDAKKHEMTEELVRAFITPIERDDLYDLSMDIDDVTDSIEDILIHMYINNITSLRPKVIEYADLLIQSCTKLQMILEELENFKKSKTLKDLLIEVNHLEEIGDSMYCENMHNIMATEKDPIQLLAWREVYECFELAYDACEDVADVVESIIIENT